MSSPELSPTEVADRLAIIEVTHRYCWALDSRDWGLLDDVFAADATAELRSPVLVGRDAIRDRISTAIETLDATHHMVTNHLVAIDGDRATCRCYLQSQHIRNAAIGGVNFIIAGWYEDELRRTADGWRVSFRRLVQVWTEGNIDVVRPPR